MPWDTGNWLKPISIIEAVETQWSEKVPWGDRGVYRLIALKTVGDLTPAQLPRVCGVDQTGTLTIGGSDNLRKRLGVLVMMHRPEFLSKSHRPLPARLARDYPAARLAFTWEVTGNPWARESELRGRYLAEFGELPPMDCTV